MEPLVVEGKLDSLGAIAQYVMKSATDAGLDKKAAYRLRLAVDEIATNIIVHGYDEAGLEGNVCVRATIDKHSLTIRLEDNAIPYNPHVKKGPEDLDQPIENRQIGGLGIYLALEGVDEFSYEYAGDRNCNTFVMHRPDSNPVA
ncbi:ATP-binding protein [Pseudanabaena sp. PCC 6802]|uniref:ATP-binding protein n=1 Tax=Pseudanabaena sp. PCC 6802 TaxID=118173 RepID=UPI0003448D93|nr:anti-sigma regulatory factor [Pseudanabaena sp. PCC 6802]